MGQSAEEEGWEERFYVSGTCGRRRARGAACIAAKWGRYSGETAPIPVRQERNAHCTRRTRRSRATEGAGRCGRLIRCVLHTIFPFHSIPPLSDSLAPNFNCRSSAAPQLRVLPLAPSLARCLHPCLACIPACNGHHDLRLLGRRRGAVARRGFVRLPQGLVQGCPAEDEELRRLEARQLRDTHGHGAEHRGGVRQCARQVEREGVPRGCVGRQLRRRLRDFLGCAHHERAHAHRRRRRVPALACGGRRGGVGVESMQFLLVSRHFLYNVIRFWNDLFVEFSRALCW